MVTRGQGGSERNQVTSRADQTASDADQTASDADQTSSDADQTGSDADQTASERDDADCTEDQRLAEQDQASADLERLTRGDDGAGTYESTKAARLATTIGRLATHIGRGDTARGRRATSRVRDRSATARDDTVRLRDERHANGHDDDPPTLAALLQELDSLRRQAAEARAQAALDRTRAAQERAAAAVERARLEAALHSAHIDELTGALRREMGWQALGLEIDRARRGDDRFVLAFIDVDGLNGVNDRAGHAAGDHVLRTLVATMRSHLRSFDPIVRFDGDAFVCGIGGVDVDDVRRRFDRVGRSLRADTGVGISVGLAVLGDGDGVEETLARADAERLARREVRAD